MVTGAQPPSSIEPRASSDGHHSFRRRLFRGHDPNQRPDRDRRRHRRAERFARVFPEHKYSIVKALQGCASTGGDDRRRRPDAPSLKHADCGSAVSGATDGVPLRGALS